MDPSTLSKIENNKTMPSIFDCIAIAEAFKISVDYVMRGVDIPVDARYGKELGEILELLQKLSNLRDYKIVMGLIETLIKNSK